MTPLKTTKNMSTIEPAMRIWDAMPMAPPTERISICVLEMRIAVDTHEVPWPLYFC